MEFEPKDIDVVQLLKKLKASNGVYPQEMLVSRRQGYLKQVAEISGAAGLSMGLRNITRNGGGAGAAPAAGALVEALLVVAILTEAGAVAYFYRDKVRDLFQSSSNSPQVEIVSEIPEAVSTIAILDATLTPEVTATWTVTETETPTPFDTPTVELAVQATQQNVDESGSNNGTNPSSSVSTPNPNDDNGNHYGQTPKPERTREPGNDNSDEQQESSPPGSNRKNN
jgi:hypothetical protein